MIGWFANAIEVACAIRLAASRPAPVDREAVERALIETLPGVGKPSNKSVRDIAVDRVLSLLRPAEPVEAKWRPIETAPKEDPERPGRDFEIIVGGGEIKDESADLLPWRPFDSWSLACYDSMRGCWRGEQTEQYDCFYLHKPTHWMPKFAGPGQCEPTTPDAVGEPVATFNIKKIDPEKLYSYNPEAKVEFDREPVAWSASTHDEIIKRLMANVGMPNSQSLYSAFKQFANELHYLAIKESPPKSSDTSAEGMREALLDATANLVGAASAYRKHAARHRSIGRAIADPFFTTRAGDLEKAAERAQAAIRQLPTSERGG